MTKYVLERNHGARFHTPGGIVAPAPDGLYRLTDAQREYLRASYGVTAHPTDDAPPSPAPSEREILDAKVAQANIDASRAAAEDIATQSQRIPIPQPPKAKRKR